MSTEEKKFVNYKRLSFPGLKPSDYYLFKEVREYFQCDTRQLVALGLRLIYSGFHDPRFREVILEIAKQVLQDDLDKEDKATRPNYTSLKDIKL